MEPAFARLKTQLLSDCGRDSHWNRMVWRLHLAFPRFAPLPKYSLVIRFPATSEMLAALEQKYGVTLPADVIECYRYMDGADFCTNESMVRLWPIAEWQPYSEVYESEPADPSGIIDDLLVMADQGISAWHYGIDLDPTRLGRVYYLGVSGPALVALSFTEFVDKALANFARSLPKLSHC